MQILLYTVCSWPNFLQVWLLPRLLSTKYRKQHVELIELIEHIFSIAGNMEGTDICSTQTPHICTTRFSTWPSLFPLYTHSLDKIVSLHWLHFYHCYAYLLLPFLRYHGFCSALRMSGGHITMNDGLNWTTGHHRWPIPRSGSCDISTKPSDLLFGHCLQPWSNHGHTELYIFSHVANVASSVSQFLLYTIRNIHIDKYWFTKQPVLPTEF